MENIRIAVLSGRLSRDPELKKTQSGVSFLKINIAVAEPRKTNDSWGEYIHWFTVDCWRNTADFLAKYAKKGDNIVVQCKPQYTETGTAENKKYYVTFKAEVVELNKKKAVDTAEVSTEDLLESAVEINPEDVPF